MDASPEAGRAHRGLMKSLIRAIPVLAAIVLIGCGSSSAGSRTDASSGPRSNAGSVGPVTLRAIDGGPSYYCSNRFTYACNRGWDKASLFPILDDYAFYPSHSTTTFKALGLNTDVRVTGGTNMSLLRAAGMAAIQAGDSASNTGSETVGGHVEEPGSWSDITNQASSLNSQFGLAGRFLQPSFTWNQLYYGTISGNACGGNGEMTMREIMSCSISTSSGTIHLNIPTDDLYWFAGSGVSGIQYQGGLIYTGNGSATADEMARGSNYGDMVDTMRGWLKTYPAPAAPYIETEDGLVGGGREITPPEFNWAVWSTITHGARLLVYFGTTSNYGSGATFGFSQKILTGQSISMYNQAKATDALVKRLAPVINSPFAMRYATVTPAAYVFPTPHRVWSTGIDVMAKYETSSHSFYIFATPRASESQTNIKATFHLAGTYAGQVSFTCACSPKQTTGAVTVSGGQFTDTFAHASDTHVYGPIPGKSLLPAVSSFTPTSGITGSQVTITGSNFNGASSVKFGSKAASFTVVSGSEVKATVPNGAVAGRISVTTALGTGTSAANFTPTLSVSGFSPTSGPHGTVVTITGVGFNSSTAVRFNGVASKGVTHVSSTQLKATVPSTATTGPITVTNATGVTGTVHSAASYTVN